MPLQCVGLSYGDGRETINTPTVYSMTNQCYAKDPDFVWRIALTAASHYLEMTYEESQELRFGERAPQWSEDVLRIGDKPLPCEVTRLNRGVLILRPSEYPWRLLSVLDRWEIEPQHWELYDATAEILPLPTHTYPSLPHRR